MKAYTYISEGTFGFVEKPKPELMDPGDAVVKVTLASICSSDLHIKHGSVPRAVPVLMQSLLLQRVKLTQNHSLHIHIHLKKLMKPMSCLKTGLMA